MKKKITCILVKKLTMNCVTTSCMYLKEKDYDKYTLYCDEEFSYTI